VQNRGEKKRRVLFFPCMQEPKNTIGRGSMEDDCTLNEITWSDLQRRHRARLGILDRSFTVRGAWTQGRKNMGMGLVRRSRFETVGVGDSAGECRRLAQISESDGSPTRRRLEVGSLVHSCTVVLAPGERDLYRQTQFQHNHQSCVANPKT
jgi:hypothetical protein